MIVGIQDVYLNVTNMEKSVKFYTEALGMKVKMKDDYWTNLDAWGVNIGLHWTEGEEVPLTPRDSHGQNCGSTITFKSDDINSDKERLEKAGVKILGEADAEWGHMLVFEDLDGNVMKLMKPKY